MRFFNKKAIFEKIFLLNLRMIFKNYIDLKNLMSTYTYNSNNIYILIKHYCKIFYFIVNFLQGVKYGKQNNLSY